MFRRVDDRTSDPTSESEVHALQQKSVSELASGMKALELQDDTIPKSAFESKDAENSTFPMSQPKTTAKLKRTPSFKGGRYYEAVAVDGTLYWKLPDGLGDPVDGDLTYIVTADNSIRFRRKEKADDIFDKLDAWWEEARPIMQADAASCPICRGLIQ